MNAIASKMRPWRGFGIAITLALAVATGWNVSAHDTAPTGVDLTRLPLGDNKMSTEPKQGWLWACRLEARRFPPLPTGPWIHDDGTYDLTAKATVSGSVKWPHHFDIAVEGDKRVLVSNDLPEHATGTFPISPSDPVFPFDHNPNRIQEQTVRIELPLNPTVAPQASCAPGAVGILLTGVSLFNGFDAVGKDAVATEVQDACQGHPQVTGTYHYHSLTKCIEDKPAPGQHSALVGYALDGFGIFGHYGEGGKALTSADLDACHGHTHKILWDGKVVEMYHYHATWDFPYTVGCLRGTMNLSALAAVGGMPHMDRGRGARLENAAAALGISVDRLRDALGPPPPDLKAAAARLGVDEDRLRQLLAPEPQ